MGESPLYWRWGVAVGGGVCGGADNFFFPYLTPKMKLMKMFLQKTSNFNLFKFI